MSASSAGILFPILVGVLFPRGSSCYNLLFMFEMNCSQYCKCSENTLDSTMWLYNQRHFEYMGQTYRSELSFPDANTDYLLFLGVFTYYFNRIAEISCELSDGLNHTITSLLNGANDEMYTALEVKCRNGENLVWDIPGSHTSFNIFVSEHCRLVTPEMQKAIVIPINLWIFDVENGGDELFDLIHLKYTTNIVSLGVKGSQTSGIPKHWKGKELLSASLLNFRNNSIEHFDCAFHFTKRLDTLSLDGNNMSRFPDCVLNQLRINYLSLAKNRISDLTALYETQESAIVPYIRILNLSGNKIGSIEVIRDMNDLVSIDLSHNVIREITNDAFRNLKKLEQLYLSNNLIHKLGSHAFNRNVNLRILNLTHNFVSTMEQEQIPAASSLLELDVRNNRLLFPPFMDCATNKLQNLNLKIYSASNPFVCDCQMIAFEKCQKWITEDPDNQTSAQNIFEDFKDLRCEVPLEVTGSLVSELIFQKLCILSEQCPPLCDCSLENVENLIVNCSSRMLLEMPDTIPSYPNTSVLLYLDHNPLQMLSHRAYLRSLSELRIDNCLLSAVTPAAISALQNIRVLTLHNNLLYRLPPNTRNITLNYEKNVTLHNNRWGCSCDSLWLPQWITKHKSSTWMPGKVLCNYLGKPVEELSEMEINCYSTSSYLDTFLAVSLALSTAVTTLVIVFCFRSEINMLLYSKLGLRIGYNFSHGDFFNPYDAFISYSQENYRWVVDTLVPHLETGPRKYRLCLHYRDFPNEESVIENISSAIRLSRCSVLVLSKNFLKKEWSIMEVGASFQRMLLVTNKLLIITTDDISVSELSPDLRAYMSTHEYLRVGESCFWDKLEMYLPPQPVSSPDQDDSSIAKGTGAGDSLLEAGNLPDKYEDAATTDITESSGLPIENACREF